jgi:hypothetical protein
MPLITVAAFLNTLTTFTSEIFSLAMTILIPDSPWRLLPVDPDMIKMLAGVTYTNIATSFCYVNFVFYDNVGHAGQTEDYL